MILDDVRKHYRGLWGDPSRNAVFKMFGHRIEVYKWSEETNPEEVNMYATVGMSAHPIAGHDPSHRLELFCGFKPSLDEIAKPLAMAALDPVLHETELGDGHTITYPEPLWPGTDIHSVIVLKPASDIVPPLLTDEDLHVEFLQMVPIFSSELEFKKKYGHRELFARWAEKMVPLWDPHRAADAAPS